MDSVSSNVLLAIALLSVVFVGVPMAYLMVRSLSNTPPPTPKSSVDWSESPSVMWQRTVLAAPEVLDAAAARLLGPAAVDAIVDELVREGAGDLATADVVSEPTEGNPKPVFFKEGEPTTLEEYDGQTHITSYLKAMVGALDPHEVLPREPQLLLGPAGLGKTLLAKCFTNALSQRAYTRGLTPVWFQEEFPADLPDLKSLDAMMRRAASRPTVLFIDEIHDLKTEGHALKLYLLLEEGRYKFEGDDSPTEMPHVLLVGATTDYGSMHEALKRRFNRHHLEPMTQLQIRAVLAKRAKAVMPATDEALDALVARTHFSGAPWEAIQLYRQARNFARARGADHVELRDVEQVFESQRIDELGLRWDDRRVIEVLLNSPRHRRDRKGEQEFVCYGASEGDVCAMARIDRGEYRDSIKPRLMARGLLEVRPLYGQALKDLAVRAYGWLAKAG